MKTLAFFFAVFVAVTCIYFGGTWFARKSGAEAGKTAAHELKRSFGMDSDTEKKLIEEADAKADQSRRELDRMSAVKSSPDSVNLGVKIISTP